jgi:hypothetical protein
MNYVTQIHTGGLSPQEGVLHFRPLIYCGAAVYPLTDIFNLFRSLCHRQAEKFDFNIELEQALILSVYILARSDDYTESIVELLQAQETSGFLFDWISRPPGCSVAKFLNVMTLLPYEVDIGLCAKRCMRVMCRVPMELACFYCAWCGVLIPSSPNRKWICEPQVFDEALAEWVIRYCNEVTSRANDKQLLAEDIHFFTLMSMILENDGFARVLLYRQGLLTIIQAVRVRLRIGESDSSTTIATLGMLNRFGVLRLELSDIDSDQARLFCHKSAELANELIELQQRDDLLLCQVSDEFDPRVVESRMVLRSMPKSVREALFPGDWSLQNSRALDYFHTAEHWSNTDFRQPCLDAKAQNSIGRTQFLAAKNIAAVEILANDPDVDLDVINSDGLDVCQVLFCSSGRGIEDMYPFDYLLTTLARRGAFRRLSDEDKLHAFLLKHETALFAKTVFRVVSHSSISCLKLYSRIDEFIQSGDSLCAMAELREESYLKLLLRRAALAVVLCAPRMRLGRSGISPPRPAPPIKCLSSDLLRYLLQSLPIE